MVAGVGGATAQESELHMGRLASAPMVSMFGGSGAYLGVEIADVDDRVVEEAGLPEEYGVYVESVVEEGPAAEAGLQDGDVLLEWNGERLESVAQLQRLMRETPAGRTVSLGVMRDGERHEVSVELGDRARASKDLHVFTVPRDRSVFMREGNEDLGERIRERLQFTPRGDFSMGTFGRPPRLGVRIQGLGEQLAEYFGVKGGALVTEVSEDSPAAAGGITAGDVIVEIDGKSVDDPEDLLEALSGRDAGPVAVEVVRDGSRRSFTVELTEPEEGGFGPFGHGAAGFNIEMPTVKVGSIRV